MPTFQPQPAQSFTLVAPYRGESVNLKISLAKSWKYARTIVEATEGAGGSVGIGRVLAALGEEWDLKDQDGEPVPIAEEIFDQLEAETMTAFINQLLDALGNFQEAKAEADSKSTGSNNRRKDKRRRREGDPAGVVSTDASGRSA